MLYSSISGSYEMKYRSEIKQVAMLYSSISGSYEIEVGNKTGGYAILFHQWLL